MRKKYNYVIYWQIELKSQGKKNQQLQSTTSTDQQSRAAIRWKYPQIELAGGVTDISQ